MNTTVNTALVLLTEESCEVGQVVQKIHRFGFAAFNPNDEARTTNRQILEHEVGDFLYVVELLVATGALRPEHLTWAMYKKCDKLKRFTHIPQDELPMPGTILLANPQSAQPVPSSTMHAKLKHLHETCKRNGASMHMEMLDDGQARVSILTGSYGDSKIGAYTFTAPYLEQALDLAIQRLNEEEAR